MDSYKGMLIFALIVFHSMNLQLCQGDGQVKSNNSATSIEKCNKECSKQVKCPDGCICGRLGDNENGTCYDISGSGEYDYSSPNYEEIEKATPIPKQE
uniref:Basic tail secreted protein n=1 Tax=Rhipicephalus appendiculatus TaxID=34631 RepID=A0A131Z5G1_RHIAP